MAHDPLLADRVRRTLTGRADIAEKRMVGGLSFSVGGRMAAACRGTL